MYYARSLYATVAACFFLPALARAADISANWDGSTNAWSDAAAWARPVYPDNGSPAGATYAVAVNSGASDLTNVAPTVNALTWTGGAITSQSIVRNGDTVVGGQLTVQNTADLSGNLTLGNDFFVFNGTTTIGAAAPTTLSTLIGVPNLYNNGSLTISNQTTVNGVISLFNAGDLDISAKGDSALALLSIQNSGTVHLHSGTVSTMETSTDTGAYTLDSGATLLVASDSFAATSSISGEGNVADNNESVNIRGTYAISGTTSVIGGDATLRFYGAATTGTVTIQNGSLVGGGSLSAGGPVSWTGGIISLLNGFTANAGVTLAPSTATLGGSFTVPQSQTFTFGDSTHAATLSINAGAALTNNGTWNAGRGVLVAQQSTSNTAPQITNAGTLTINAPGSSLAFEDAQSGVLPLSLINTGLINVNAGEFLLAASGHPSLGGTIHVAAGATLLIVAPISLDDAISGDGGLYITNSFFDANGHTVHTSQPSVTFNGMCSLTGRTTIINTPTNVLADTSLHDLAANFFTFSGTHILTLDGDSSFHDINLSNLSVLVNGSLSDTSRNTVNFTLDGAFLSIAAGAAMTMSLTEIVILKNHASFINNGLLSFSGVGPNFHLTAALSGGSFTNNGTVTSDSSLAFTSALTFSNNGILDITHGTLQIASGTDTANAVINVSAGATLLVSTRPFTAGTINNAGVMTISASTATATLGSALSLVNTGSLETRSGTLLLAAPQDPASTGNFEVYAGATLEFAADYDFSTSTDPTFNGTGLVIVDPGVTLTLPMDTPFSGTIEINGALVLTPPRDPGSIIITPHFSTISTPVPEPASLALLALGAAALVTGRRK